MCIVLLTTAHPDYALIVLDNRDEFILRPTSRPHWWTPGPETTAGADAGANAEAGAPAEPPAEPGEPPAEVLSARDLQRPEHGTWLGITRAGHFAVLTNFREEAPHDAAHPVRGQRSRGAMVTAWLTARRAETTAQFVARMLAGPGVRGVGGFSLICGKLRRRAFLGGGGGGGGGGGDSARAGTGPLAVVSNRADQLAQVPWIAGRRGAVYGLSNACYDDPDVWPKVRDGKAALQALMTTTNTPTPSPPTDPDALRVQLFAILDRDTLPRQPGLSFEQQVPLLKHSIFVPPLGSAADHAAMAEAVAAGLRPALDVPASAPVPAPEPAPEPVPAGRPEKPNQPNQPDQPPMGFMTGLYGTQRQTVLLVDWQGRVSFTERALWDAHGNAIPRGQGDVHFAFQIEGWDDDVGPDGAV